MDNLKRQLLKDWKSNCKKVKKFDDSHFYTLFHADPLLSEEEIISVFQYYKPQQKELTKRLLSIFNVIFNDKRPILKKEEIIEYALKDIKEKLKICQEHYEDTEEFNEFLEDYGLPKNVEKLVVEFTNDQELFNQYLKDTNNPGYELNIYSDYVFSALIDKKQFDCTYALQEAVYGLVQNHSLVSYALSPLLQKPVNFDNYFYLWESGNKYIFQPGNILILSHKMTK